MLLKVTIAPRWDDTLKRFNEGYPQPSLPPPPADIPHIQKGQIIDLAFLLKRVCHHEVPSGDPRVHKQPRDRILTNLVFDLSFWRNIPCSFDEAISNIPLHRSRSLTRTWRDVSQEHTPQVVIRLITVSHGWRTGGPNFVTFKLTNATLNASWGDYKTLIIRGTTLK